MDHRITMVAVVITLLVFSVRAETCGGLSYQFYDESCPQVEDIVRDSLQTIFLSDPTTPASLLRLVFHDCQVQGCDASILIDSKTTEMTSSKNSGIRNREIISLIKSMVEASCPKQVSCADIIIMAAREAVAMSDGPYIEVPFGRRDSSAKPSSELADAMLPSPSIGVDDMLHIFTRKGMTIEESVAIMGAHTLGITHCFNILDRLRELKIGDVKQLKPDFEAYLRLNCHGEDIIASNLSFVANDPTTFVFDNQYFANLMRGHGVLNIDAEMVSERRTTNILEEFSMDQDYFYREFSSAFVKLSCSGVLTRNQGVIRKYCNEIE